MTLIDKMKNNEIDFTAIIDNEINFYKKATKRLKLIKILVFITLGITVISLGLRMYQLHQQKQALCSLQVVECN